jgi:hypothetical protein
VSKPAGVQIRFWIWFLGALLLLVDLTALTGSLLVTRSIRAVSERAAPVAATTAAIRQEIMGAQNELFRYLAELSDDTSRAVARIDSLGQQLTTLRSLDGSDTALAGELDTIRKSAEQYRKVLALLPGTVEGVRDWARLQEYSEAAIRLGLEVEQRVGRLADQAQKEILAKNRDATRVASAAMWGSVAVLTISLLALLALRHWWKRFEDTLLGF